MLASILSQMFNRLISPSTMNPLDNIRIVLVRTYHAGNIGSAARSLKTMGLSDLALVNPRDFPAADANRMAAGAESAEQFDI